MVKTKSKVPQLETKTVVYKAMRLVTDKDYDKLERMLDKGWIADITGFQTEIVLHKFV